MKPLTVVAAISIVLMTVPAFAKTHQKPQAKPPATQQQPPAQATQKPAAPAPAQQTPPIRPFPEGAKIAVCQLQIVFQNSKEGQAMLARSQALREKKIKELDEKNKALTANQQKVQSPTLDENARAALQKEIERQQVDIQRTQQDAQSEVTDLENNLREQFEQKLRPIVNQVAAEKGLQMILVYEPQLLYWVDPSIDLTGEIIKRFDLVTASGTAPKTPGRP